MVFCFFSTVRCTFLGYSSFFSKLLLDPNPILELFWMTKQALHIICSVSVPIMEYTASISYPQAEQVMSYYGSSLMMIVETFSNMVSEFFLFILMGSSFSIILFVIFFLASIFYYLRLIFFFYSIFSTFYCIFDFNGFYRRTIF